MKTFAPYHTLYHGVQLAAILDLRFSEFRRIVTDDPGALPQPIWLGTSPYWPTDQIGEWIDVGAPRDFGLHALSYLPAEFRKHDTGRPPQPFAGWEGHAPVALKEPNHAS